MRGLCLAFLMLSVGACVRAMDLPERPGRADGSGNHSDGPGNYVVTTIAGSGVAGYQDGPALQAQFNEPYGIVLDKAGELLIVDKVNCCIRILDVATQQVDTFAGTCGTCGSQDGPAATASFGQGHGIAVDTDGKVYVADTSYHTIRVIENGQVSTHAGSSKGFVDGPATTAQFDAPYGVAVDGAGVVYVADRDNHAIRTVEAGEVTTLAGDGTMGFADGQGAAARFSMPYATVAAEAGTVIVADYGNHRVRSVTAAGQVTTFAGSGVEGFKDGPAAAAELDGPRCVAVDSAGRVYVVDNGNHSIRMIENGQVSTFAGTGEQGTLDGPVSQAEFHDPAGVAVDAAGRVYVTEKQTHVVRVIAPQ
jgi:hypothetical protein